MKNTKEQKSPFTVKPCILFKSTIEQFHVDIWLIIMREKFNLPNIFWKIEFQCTHADQTCPREGPSAFF